MVWYLGRRIRDVVLTFFSLRESGIPIQGVKEYNLSSVPKHLVYKYWEGGTEKG